MSLKRAVSISLGSLSGSVGSRLSSEESSKARLFMFAIVLLCIVDYCAARKENSKVPTFAKSVRQAKSKLQLYCQCVNSVLP